MNRRPELLVPASNLEVLKVAVRYGADAVYIGGEAFGLRAKAKNFSMEDMREGIRYAHAHGVRVHVTANILAHNRDLPGMRAYFQELKELQPDALIIADPGAFMLAREICPEIDIHVSTQANNTNYADIPVLACPGGEAGGICPGTFPGGDPGDPGKHSGRHGDRVRSSTAPCAFPIPADVF